MTNKTNILSDLANTGGGTFPSTFLIGSSSSTELSGWLDPEIINFIELEDSIEFVYKQKSIYSYLNKERVFKIIFSCKKGKWNKSEPIYGTLIPATKEGYSFPA